MLNKCYNAVQGNHHSMQQASKQPQELSYQQYLLNALSTFACM